MPGLNVTKCTFAFLQGAQGWTENYYLNGASSSLQPELTRAQTLAQKRVLCSGTQTIITHVKVSNDMVSRDVLVGDASYPGDPGQDSDAPDTALLMYRYGPDNAVRSQLFMRGIWDDVILAGGEFDFGNPGWTTRFNAFVAELTRSPAFGFLGRIPASSKKSAIATITPTGDGRLDIVTTDNIFNGIPVGTKLKTFVSGCTGSLSVNGQQIVTAAAATRVTTLRRIPIFPYTGGGSISYTVPEFKAITRVLIERVVERKVGRPLFQSAGRRPARRLG